MMLLFKRKLKTSLLSLLQAEVVLTGALQICKVRCSKKLISLKNYSGVMQEAILDQTSSRRGPFQP